MQRHRAIVLALSALVMPLALAACGGGEDAEGSGEFNDQFPAAVFDGLEGEVVWYVGTGGTSVSSREETVFKNFTDLTGVATQADVSPGMAKFYAAAEKGGDLPWSLVEFGTKGDYLQAREAGLLEPLDYSKIPKEDLEEGTYDEFGMDFWRSASVLTYNTESFPDEASAPKKLSDLYDTATYPGKRCLFQYPQYGATLESALLADGVAAEDLYPLDVDRAFAKLDTIKDDIVWWSDGEEVVRLMAAGECDLGITWSGRTYNGVVNNGAPLAIAWGEAMTMISTYGIPKGAPNVDAAQALLSMWVRDLDGQEAMLTKIPYVNPIIPLAERGFPENLQPWLAAGDNLETTFAEDSEYYGAELAELSPTFDAWVSKG